MNIHDYLLDQTGLDWSSLLQEWHWLLPPEFRVWMLTRMGDLFIALPDDSIHMLDVGAGRLQRVAQSRDEFCAKINEPGVADDWLKISIIDQLVASGAVLGPGQCYSFRQLPVLGGAYSVDNQMVFPIREHFGAWGSVQRQISDLPDGSHVVIKPVANSCAAANLALARWLPSWPRAGRRPPAKAGLSRSPKMHCRRFANEYPAIHDQVSN